MTNKFLQTQAASSLALTFMLALSTGCGSMGNSLPSANSLNTGGAMQGSLFGGNQPIIGATVQLWSVGATGYGSKGTLYASTTTSAPSGGFSFTQAVAGVTPGATTPPSANYGCPASGDPQMYLLAKGGNPGAGANAAAASLVAIGKCSQVSSLFVDMNEVTTVATMAAMQQYFNPTEDTLGSPATAQAQIGLANAQSVIGTMTDIAAGTARTSFTPTSQVAGATITATPETAKINTMANILSTCVNSTGPLVSSDPCSVLFANAIPQINTLTSQPTATFNAATDTVQALYYMFTNPTESQDNGPSGKLSKIYNLSNATPPFAPTLTAAPLDWTLAISYSAGTTTCTSTSSRFFNPTLKSVAVDANGNVWMNGGSSANNSLVQLAPNGAPMNCYGGTLGVGLGLAIDTVGNVYSGAATGIYEVPVNGSPFTWSATSLSGMTVDKSGNLFYVPSTATPVQEFKNASAATAPSASIPVGSAINSGTYFYVAADTAGRIFAPSTTAGTYLNLYPVATGGTNGYAYTDIGASAATTNSYGAAIDSAGKVFGGTTCCAPTTANTFFSLTVTPGTPPAVTLNSSAKYLGGLVGTRGVAVDGAGNVWAGMAYAVVDANTAVTPNTPAIYALAEVSNDLTTSISPMGSGVTPTPCASASTDCPTGGGFQKPGYSTNIVSLAIDPSGNVWAPANSKSLLVELVGQAVPVVTPLIAAPGAKP